MKPVRKVCHTMQGWTLTRGAWSLWSEIRRHVNVMDSYLTIGCVMYYGPWCYRLTSARNEQSAGKPLLQHCRSMGLWCDQGELLPWASTYWQSDGVSPWGAPFTPAICRVGWPLLKNSPLIDVPISALFWLMKEDSWFVSQMRIWHALASHGSPCAFQLQLWIPEEGFWDSYASASHSFTWVAK